MRKIQIEKNIYDLSKKPLIMGIVNVTPDSFSDGGKYSTTDTAVAHAKKMIQEGADIIDVGGESTRPGSLTITKQEELKRVIPVITRLHDQTSTPLSIDTSKAIVAQQAIEQGAALINDITALQGDPSMVTVISEHKVPVCLMHMKGTPKTMQQNPCYTDVIDDIKQFFEQRIAYATTHGVHMSQIILDPGIGFGKRTGGEIEDNCIILNRLGELTTLGCPLLVGASRKTFIGNICGGKTVLPPSDRLEGSLAAACVALLHGADILRVHDVKETKRCLDLISCVMEKTP